MRSGMFRVLCPKQSPQHPALASPIQVLTKPDPTCLPRSVLHNDHSGECPPFYGGTWNVRQIFLCLYFNQKIKNQFLKIHEMKTNSPDMKGHSREILNSWSPQHDYWAKPVESYKISLLCSKFIVKSLRSKVLLH